MHNTTRGSLKLSNACDVYTIAVQIKKKTVITQT